MRRLAFTLLVAMLALGACTASIPDTTPTPQPSQGPQVVLDGTLVSPMEVEPLPPEVRDDSVFIDPLNAPQVAVMYDGDYDCGIEGCDATFLEVIGSDGTVIMDVRMRLPGEVVYLPVGRYAATAYLRWCNADACTMWIGPREDICSTDLQLRTRREYTLVVRKALSRCDFAEAD